MLTIIELHKYCVALIRPVCVSLGLCSLDFISWFDFVTNEAFPSTNKSIYITKIEVSVCDFKKHVYI